MKKIVITCLALFFVCISFAQTGDFVYVNPKNGSKGVMYKKPDGSGYYTVLPHNTLYSISKLHSMTVDELQSVNSLTGTTIRIGQKLVVKSTTEIGGGLNLGETTSSTQANVVLEEEHLQLSNGNLEVSASHPAVIRAEKLKSEGIDMESMKGKHIERENEWWYIASDEDNFHLIATKYDMTFNELRDKNQLNDYLYRPGMVLLVVAGKNYGVKTYPEVMPELPEEKVLSQEEASEIISEVVDSSLTSEESDIIK